jgi:hypothetical protein
LIVLHQNPQLLVFHNDPPVRNNIECLGVMHAFFNYECTSDFARLYQLAAGNAPVDVVQAAFSRLPVTVKNALYGKVWVEAGGPMTGDAQWGEHHTFEDMPRFQRALKRDVCERLGALSPDQNAQDHILRLIDTLFTPQ